MDLQVFFRFILAEKNLYLGGCINNVCTRSVQYSDKNDTTTIVCHTIVHTMFQHCHTNILDFLYLTYIA
jgi:hypothetical protein